MLSHASGEPWVTLVTPSTASLLPCLSVARGSCIRRVRLGF
jgi:hypothetical protein